MGSIVEYIINNPIEIIGFLLGLGYLFYEYKASKWVWLFAILMPCISMSVYYSKGIYADFTINIYYLVTAIYGFFVWHKGGVEKSGKPITKASKKTIVGCIGVMLFLWIFICFILVEFTDSNVPIPDAFTTALSMVGSWMLARKYIQQWIVWIVVDGVCVGLYLYKDIYSYAVLYAIYTVIAYFGYKKWQRLMSGLSGS